MTSPIPALSSATRTPIVMTAHFMMAQRVLCNMDVLELVLLHTDLDPEYFVYAGAVCKSWRYACRTCPSLVLHAAKGSRFSPKETFVKLFAIEITDAEWCARASIDTQHTFEFALAATGGITGWQQRLTRRAATQASIERTFGPNWRELRSPNTWTCKHPKRQRLYWQGGFRVHSTRDQRRPSGWNARQIRRSRCFR